LQCSGSGSAIIWLSCIWIQMHMQKLRYPNPHLIINFFICVPRAQKREDQRAAGSPAALTQLALCLRLAPILRPKADNARNPQ
jgi:hypothetical protein